MLIIVIQTIAILAMVTFMFIGIWGFILLIQILNQLRYKNYLMEKLTQNTYRLSLNHETKDFPKDNVENEDSIKFTDK